MSIKKIVLLCVFLLFLATPVIAYQYWEELLQLMGVRQMVDERQEASRREIPADFDPATFVFPPSTEYISPWTKEHVEMLQKQSLEESFEELEDGQNHFMYIPSGNRSEDIHRILSTRIFLKVYQQFMELPREQALEKLHQFTDRAIQGYTNSLGLSLEGIAAQEKDPSLSIEDVLENVTGPFSVRGGKYMLFTTMLLAARMGEYDLLLHQINTMQSCTNAYLEKLGEGLDSSSRLVVSLEDDCIFTLLTYAIERKEGKLDVDVSPFYIITSEKQADELREKFAADSLYFLKQSTIPLYRWDAYTTHYELGIKDPNALIDQITIYMFDTSVRLGGSIQVQIDEDMQLVLDSLKERLAQ